MLSPETIALISLLALATFGPVMGAIVAKTRRVRSAPCQFAATVGLLVGIAFGVLLANALGKHDHSTTLLLFLVFTPGLLASIASAYYASVRADAARLTEPEIPFSWGTITLACAAAATHYLGLPHYLQTRDPPSLQTAAALLLFSVSFARLIQIDLRMPVRNRQLTRLFLAVVGAAVMVPVFFFFLHKYTFPHRYYVTFLWVFPIVLPAAVLLGAFYFRRLEVYHKLKALKQVIALKPEQLPLVRQVIRSELRERRQIEREHRYLEGMAADPAHLRSKLDEVTERQTKRLAAILTSRQLEHFERIMKARRAAWQKRRQLAPR